MNAKMRARVYSEWRGLPEIPFTKHNAQMVAGPLAKLMNQLGLKERLGEEEVLAAWKDVVGEFIAQHAEPQRLKDGVLFVRVLQSTVHYELDRVWKPKILEKLRARFGRNMIREVRFRMG
jgi:predicted nucleic acid-binding Zn ribbon protein